MFTFLSFSCFHFCVSLQSTFCLLVFMFMHFTALTFACVYVCLTEIIVYTYGKKSMCVGAKLSPIGFSLSLCVCASASVCVRLRGSAVSGLDSVCLWGL